MECITSLYSMKALSKAARRFNRQAMTSLSVDNVRQRCLCSRARDRRQSAKTSICCMSEC